MKTKNKHQHAGGEVTEFARETAKVEQYWIVTDPNRVNRRRITTTSRNSYIFKSN
jgi:hypothetical protein